MKKNERKEKLFLKKVTIATLSDSEKKLVIGGTSSTPASEHWMNCYPFTGGKCQLR